MALKGGCESQIRKLLFASPISKEKDLLSQVASLKKVWNKTILALGGGSQSQLSQEAIQGIVGLYVLIFCLHQNQVNDKTDVVLYFCNYNSLKRQKKYFQAMGNEMNFSAV